MEIVVIVLRERPNNYRCKRPTTFHLAKTSYKFPTHFYATTAYKTLCINTICCFRFSDRTPKNNKSLQKIGISFIMWRWEVIGRVKLQFIKHQWSSLDGRTLTVEVERSCCLENVVQKCPDSTLWTEDFEKLNNWRFLIGGVLRKRRF